MAYRFSPWRVLMECATSSPGAVVAGHPGAEAFVTDAVRELLRIVGDATLTTSRRAAAFASAVGRLTDAPIARAYDGRLWPGPVDGMTLLGSTSRRPDEVIVMISIRDDRAFAPIQMSWRVARSAGEWRLIDVECCGVWLSGERRSTLAGRRRE
ncbi:ABC transporter substrate-binding protein [Caulobacter segnis]|uniref:ABC transporter substrate-binding protein n=1 Tax=Caulobacter segnis TaxID=88688 RepID=UPI001CBBAF3B|nr:ABC transporter substrate-binding protein [Caulobacter segnis]UAL12423.1 ABC transporter substrate-binding protein [Caulobacter segnis]